MSDVATSLDMPPKSIPVDVRLTPRQVERCEVLAEIQTCGKPDIIRQALDLGLDALEKRIVEQYQFKNSLLVNAKLKRRPEDIHAAIAMLEEESGNPEVIALLKRAIG
jgi:hypothetical protein